MKLKKISFSIMAILLTSSVICNTPVRAAPKNGIYSNGENVIITTQGIPASSGVRYRTVGWTINHKNHNMIMDRKTTNVQDLGRGASRFTLPLSSNTTNSIYAQMGGEKSPELINFFYNGGILTFNARMTVFQNGRETGELYTTQNGIANARGWAGGYHQFDSYFNQKLKFPPQAVAIHLNVAHQLLDENGTRIGLDRIKNGAPAERLFPEVFIEKGKKVRPVNKGDNLTFSAKEFDGYEFAYSCFSKNAAVGNDTDISNEKTRTFDITCPTNAKDAVDANGNFITGQKYLIFYYKPKSTQIPNNNTGSGDITNKVSLAVESDGDGVVTGGGTKELTNGKATFTGISATPNKDSIFTGWSVEYGDDIFPDSNGSVTIAKNTKLVAHFIKNIIPNNKMVNLTVRAYPTFAGTVTGGGNKMLTNGKATFTGITQKPNKYKFGKGSWKFSHWSTTKGNRVIPSNKTVSISQDTILIANYYLDLPSKDKIFGNESSNLKVSGTVNRNPAKEGQLITFTVKTKSNDFRYPITDYRGWQRSHTPGNITYGKDQYGFLGTLYGDTEKSKRVFDGYRCHTNKKGRDVCHAIYHTEYYRDYKGTVYRQPVQWFSAQKLRLYFPDEIKNLPTLNDFNINPYVEWYISSKPVFTEGKHFGEVIRSNTEKIEFYLPLKTPVTIRNDGVRLREPYRIKVEAIETNGYITAESYIDLDIKGNIYEGIYTTPIG